MHFEMNVARWWCEQVKYACLSTMARQRATHEEGDLVLCGIRLEIRDERSSEWMAEWRGRTRRVGECVSVRTIQNCLTKY